MFGVSKSVGTPGNANRWQRTMLAAAIVASVLLSATHGAQAQTPRSAAMVVDANTGEVLHTEQADAHVYPASLTKMMTLYMTFELIEMGRLSYGSKIRMTEEGAAVPPSKLGLKAGEELTVLEAIRALVTKSANDVAVAMAQHIGGSEPNFARLMTQKARALGMRQTTFRNASGLPDSGQVTTARDMITLGLRLQDDFPRHYKLFATRSFSFRGKSYRNHNTLLHRYQGTDGIKTGYTRASGFNLVSSVHRDGKHIVAAVFGGKSAATRNAKMQKIIGRSFAKASRTRTRAPASALVARAAPPPQPAQRPQMQARAELAPPPQVRPAPPPPPAASADRGRSSIAVAKVRPVQIGNAAQEQAEPQRRQQFASAGITAPLRAAPRPPAQEYAPRFVPETGALRPSTFQAQAAHLERVDTRPMQPPPQALPPPATRTVSRSAPRGPFEIQIGAFGSAAEAERRMIQARQRLGGMLDGYASVSVPVQSGGSQLYRARFRGFDATAANNTCSQMKTVQIDCFVIRAQ